MLNKDYYASADRIQLVDERLAYEMMKRNYPNYQNSKSEFDFWKGYSKIVEKDNVDYYVPFSYLMKYTENEGKLKYNYALIRLVDYLTDIEIPVFVGLDFSEYQQFEIDLIVVAEFLSKCRKIHSFEQDFIMRIKYRKGFRDYKNVYIVREKEELIAKVDNQIIDISEFRYENIVNAYSIPPDLSYQIIECIKNEFNDFVISTTIGEDDRCYINNAFSIYVPKENLNSPDRRILYSPYEYFYKGHKSAFAPFNELMSFIYDNMTDYERELFPFK